MNTLTRKQREMQEREQEILDVARPMLLEEGYLGLSMDEIARKLQVSKGTVYNHFKNKEEIIIALTIATMDIRSEMFRRAAAFQGAPRERLYAVGMASELFVNLYPDHFKVEQLIRSASIWERTSQERRAAMRACEGACLGIVAGVIRDGIAQKHLHLPDGITPEEMVFGLWAITYGAFSIMATSTSLSDMGIQDALKALRRNIGTMLDGYGWKPLSTKHNYDAVFERIAQEVFPDECQQAGYL